MAKIFKKLRIKGRFIMDELWDIVDKNYPVREVKFFLHARNWLFSRAQDYVIPNPNFDPKSKNITAMYCVHGTADYPGGLWGLAQKFLKAGLASHIKMIVLPNFPKRFRGQSIESFAEVLTDKIKFYEIDNVVLCGHSRGGLITAKFAVDYAESAGINVVSSISYGTPYSGSAVATYPSNRLSTSVKQMQLNSPFLIDLKEKILSSKTRFYFIAAPKDLLVSPNSAIIHEYEEKYPGSALLLTRSHGHLSMLTSNKAIAFAMEKASLTLDTRALADKLCAIDLGVQSDESEEEEYPFFDF